MEGFGHGKVLLFGEHAVVHGCRALGAGLSSGVLARATPAAAWSLRCPSWNLDVILDEPHRVAGCLEVLKRHFPTQPLAFELDASIPAGAGMGSSAAMAVALLRATRAFHALNDDEMTHLWPLAMEMERVFHGNPSGLDHTAAISGQVFEFVRGTPPQVHVLSLVAPLQLVIGLASPGADTGRMVAGFTERLHRRGAAGAGMLAAIGAIVDQATIALQTDDLPSLGELMVMNHGLLMGMGVSSAALDAACHAAVNAGALGAKLTGAGGGGCMIALCQPDTVERVRTSLLSVCSQTWHTTIGA
jgi:mevalonate kinase